MLSKLKKENKGFTIIEVMIVLAIAGLIILIVLLAIPALQRNGRNTSVKNDASSLAAGISEYKSNNDGAAPTTVAGTGTVTLSGAAGSANATVRVNGGTQPTAANAADATNVVVYRLSGRCNGNATQAGTARDVAISYWVETAGGGASRCIDA